MARAAVEAERERSEPRFDDFRRTVAARGHDRRSRGLRRPDRPSRRPARGDGSARSSVAGAGGAGRSRSARRRDGLVARAHRATGSGRLREGCGVEPTGDLPAQHAGRARAAAGAGCAARRAGAHGERPAKPCRRAIPGSRATSRPSGARRAPGAGRSWIRMGSARGRTAAAPTGREARRRCSAPARRCGRAPAGRARKRRSRRTCRSSIAASAMRWTTARSWRSASSPSCCNQPSGASDAQVPAGERESRERCSSRR